MRNAGGLFDDIPPKLPQELFQTLLATSSLKIERIVSNGHSSPPDFWYCEDQHEWVLVVKGEAKLRFDDQNDATHLCAGDYINIPARTRHRVEWTTGAEETIWLAIFYT